MKNAIELKKNLGSFFDAEIKNSKKNPSPLIFSFPISWLPWLKIDKRYRKYEALQHSEMNSGDFEFEIGPTWIVMLGKFNEMVTLVC